MKKVPLNILSVTIFVLLIGCATLSRNECLEANWFEIGHKDGMNGKPRALFQRHVDACIKHGVNANRNAYYAGRDEGLRIYCTGNSGYEQGRLGRKYHYVCPPDLEPEFLNAYYEGREIYEYEKKVAYLERQLKKIRKQIKEKEKDLYSNKLSDEQKANIRSEIGSLNKKYHNVVRRLISLSKMKPCY